MKTIIIGLCFYLFANLFQSTIDSSTLFYGYHTTKLPKDTTKLWINDGLESSDTVIIFCQGGPSTLLKYTSSETTIWRYLPRYQHHLNVHLHQTNTYNESLFSGTDTFTIQKAKKEIELTSEMLYRSIKYYKHRGKTVIVIGHSYGAFIIYNYMSTYESIADKYFAISGRIDVEQDVVRYHIEGRNGYFDGLSYIPDEWEDINQKNVKDKRLYLVKQLLKGAIGQPRYSKALREKDLTNLVVVYATQDKRVGLLSEREIGFLRSKNALVHPTKYPHGDSFYGLVDALVDGKIKL